MIILLLTILHLILPAGHPEESVEATPRGQPVLRYNGQDYVYRHRAREPHRGGRCMGWPIHYMEGKYPSPRTVKRGT